MSRTPTLIMLILALVLTGLALLLFRAPRGGTGAQPRTLLPSAAPPATTLAVWKDGALVCRAERGMVAGVPGWLQVEPIRYPLLTTAIEPILQAAHTLVPLEEAHGTPAELGLTPPAAMLEIAGAAIELGRRTVAGGAIARLRGSDAACIVRDQLHRLLLDTDPVAWRKRDVFDGLGIEVARVTLERGGETIRLARLRGLWRVIEPVSDVADEEQVQMLLAYLIDSDIATFVLDQPRDLEQFGLNAPVLTVTVETDRRRIAPDGEVSLDTDLQALQVGAAANVEASAFYARRVSRDCVVAVQAPLARRLRTPLADLLSRQASHVSPTEVAALSLQRGDDLATLQRTLDGWAYELQRSEAKGDAEALAAAVLGLLLEAEAMKVLPPGAEAPASDQGDSPPPALVVLRGYDTGELARFELRSVDEETLAVRDPRSGVTRHYAEPALMSTLLK